LPLIWKNGPLLMEADSCSGIQLPRNNQFMVTVPDKWKCL